MNPQNLKKVEFWHPNPEEMTEKQWKYMLSSWEEEDYSGSDDEEY